jgi:hypothetical protein
MAQPRALVLELAQPPALVAAQPVALADIDLMALDPAAQRLVDDPQLVGDRRNRLPRAPIQQPRFALEVLPIGRTAPASWHQ